MSLLGEASVILQDRVGPVATGFHSGLNSPFGKAYCSGYNSVYVLPSSLLDSEFCDSRCHAWLVHCLAHRGTSECWTERKGGRNGRRGSGRGRAIPFPSYSKVLLHNASRSLLLYFLDPTSKTTLRQVRWCLEESNHALSGLLLLTRVFHTPHLLKSEPSLLLIYPSSHWVKHKVRHKTQISNSQDGAWSPS